jgi:hypothetical protein
MDSVYKTDENFAADVAALLAPLPTPQLQVKSLSLSLSLYTHV